MRKCTFPKVQQIAFAVHHFSSLSSVQQEQRVYEYTFYLPLRSARSLIQSALTESHLNDNITFYKVVPRGPRKSTVLLSGIRQYVPYRIYHHFDSRFGAALPHTTENTTSYLSATRAFSAPFIVSICTRSVAMNVRNRRVEHNYENVQPT